MPLPQLSLAVVGADHLNKKGPTRRFEIAMCIPGEPVSIVPEPKNPKDPNALAVYSARGIQIGYIRAERCQLVHTAMRRDGVQAIFQRSETWGATIRAHLDGTQPVLPEVADSAAENEPAERDEEPDWWPDEEWPE